MKKKTMPILLLAMMLILLAASAALAQRPDHPDLRVTPDSGGSGGGGSSDDAGTPQEGMVHGYVYDYSNGAAPQGGVAVLLDGGGWQAETITNSDGYYRFAGLGQGNALLSLRLPEETTEVTAGWPAHTGTSQPDHTNLAYYWGEVPPMPVVLAVSPASVSATPGNSFEMTITVINRSGGDATDAVVDLQLPIGLTALEANTTHGEIDFSDHRIWGLLGVLPTDQTATLTVKISPDEGNATEELRAATILSYREQLTPQLVAVAVKGAAIQTQSVSEAVESAATGTDEVTVAKTKDAETTTETTTETPEEAVGKTDDLIPTTGGAETSQTVPTWPGLVFSVVFIIGLGAAGFRTLSKRRA